MSKKSVIIVIISIFMIVLLCTFIKGEVKNDWLIIPGERVGSITPKSSEKQLIEFFGEENVKREEIVVGEGEGYEIATFIFKGTKNEILVKWQDDKVLNKPSSISIYKEGTQWKTPEGITVGTTLSEINKINGMDFDISGLGWQFGGFVNSWNKGTLSKYKDRSLTIRFNGSPLSSKFYGSGKYFSSKDPGAINAGLIVDLIRIKFD